jgi:MFS family permease
VKTELARWALPMSMFLGTFAWSFVYVSLPFYIQRMSPYDAPTTLRWTGWILGISSLLTVVTAPISGRVGGQRNPKLAFVVTQSFQGVGFLIMASARSLPQLFFARMLLGLMGAVSTFAFIMAGRSGGDVRRQVSVLQSGMTLGQVLGPAVGAVTAARLGFRLSFLLGAAMLWTCSLLVGWAVPATPAQALPRGERASTITVRELGRACLLILGGLTQVFFLAAILPHVLERLGVPAASTLEVGGLVLFADGIALALGSMAAPRVAEAVGEHRAVPWLLGCSSLLLAGLPLATGVWSFVALRFLEVLCIAPVFPLSVAAIAHRASGQAIGFLNSARIGASFIGPVFATSLLAWAPPSSVELVLAGAGLALVPVFVRWPGGGRRSREGMTA